HLALHFTSAVSVLPPRPSSQQPKRGEPQSQRTWLGNGLQNGLENAEETIRLVVGTGREIDLLAAAAVHVITLDQAPAPIDDNRSSIPSGQLPQETGCRGIGVEDVNRASAEIADQQVAGDIFERRRRNRQSPRRVEHSHRTDSSQKTPLH